MSKKTTLEQKACVVGTIIFYHKCSQISVGSVICRFLRFWKSCSSRHENEELRLSENISCQCPAKSLFGNFISHRNVTKRKKIAVPIIRNKNNTQIHKYSTKYFRMGFFGHGMVDVSKPNLANKIVGNYLS